MLRREIDGMAMADVAGWIRLEEDGGAPRVAAGGEWTVGHAGDLERLVDSFTARPAKRFRFDLSAISRLDSAGAWLLCRAARRLEETGAAVRFHGLDPRRQPLLDLVRANRDCSVEPEPSRHPVFDMLERVGRSAFDVCEEAMALTGFIGVVTVTGLRALARPRRFRLVSLTNQIEQTGLNALPIVGLMAFLIGIVLAYQGATQLRRFGAEIFTIDLMAVSVLREIGVLLTAIMVAGRSGSAFTAQIGTMKVSEEIDAMRALGLDPLEILVLPRINALLVTLPILTLFADFVGIVGGAAMAVFSLDLSATQFLGRLEEAVTLDHFLVGIVKAPVFAYLIAVIGCYEGLRVEGGAESVGRLTTRAVVESIFLVIVADAAFSIMFTAMGL